MLYPDDEIRIMADGTYLLSDTLTVASAGTQAAHVTLIGANSSGIIDGSKPLISGINLDVSKDMFSLAVSTTQFLVMRHLDIGNTARYGIFGSNNTILLLDNCVFHNCSISGVYPSSSGSRLTVNRCYFHDNGYGIGQGNLSRPMLSVFCNSMFKNNDKGISMGAGCVVAQCIFNHNGNAVYANSNFSECLIQNNVFFGSTGDAIYYYANTSSYHVIIINNIFRNNNGYAINTRNAAKSGHLFLTNCFSNNTSGDSDIGTIDGIHEDPLFVSEISENFNLQANSPCIDAGLNPYGY